MPDEMKERPCLDVVEVDPASLPDDLEGALRVLDAASPFEPDSEPAPFRVREGDQPLPREVPGIPGSHELVIADLVRDFPCSTASQEFMAGRAEVGLKRYGQPLRPNNGRDTRRDAKEEAADLVAYLKTMEREGEAVDRFYHLAQLIYVGLVEGK